MIKVDLIPLGSAESNEQLKANLFNSLQDEIFNVIENARTSIDPNSTHQLYDSIQGLILKSPTQIVLDFKSEAQRSPLNQWKMQRITRVIEQVKLDPLIHQGVDFNLALLKQKPENSPYDFVELIRVRFSYHQKSGQWACHVFMSNRFDVNLIELDWNTYQLNLKETIFDVTQFVLQINPSGYLSITSPSFDCLDSSRIVLSHFKFYQRRNS